MLARFITGGLWVFGRTNALPRMIADPTFLVDPLLGLFLAMAISVVVIPVCHRMAPWLGLIDRPGERKVHAAPIARVGGWGIFVPVAIWAG